MTETSLYIQAASLFNGKVHVCIKVFFFQVLQKAENVLQKRVKFGYLVLFLNPGTMAKVIKSPLVCSNFSFTVPQNFKNNGPSYFPIQQAKGAAAFCQFMMVKKNVCTVIRSHFRQSGHVKHAIKSPFVSKYPHKQSRLCEQKRP